jgi:hypothetical protein
LETLTTEARRAEATSQEEQIRLENGWQWAPRSWVIKGDLKEMQGLIDKQTLKFVSETPKDAKVITSKVVRSFKGGGVKSRLVLRDVAKTKPSGGELHATTPSMITIRTATIITATWSNCGRRLTGSRACAYRPSYLLSSSRNLGWLDREN